MNIAKKLLAGVLVFMMSVSPVAFAEEASEDVAPVQEVTENSNYTAAAEKLQALGVLKNTSLQQTTVVGRGQFVSLLCEAMGYTTLGHDNKQIFNDVPPASVYSDAIRAAYDMGIINGTGDGYFYPDRAVTLNEAVKMSVVALGYDVYAREAGYPIGYFNQAQKLNLLDRVDCAPNDFVTAGDVYQLLVNIVDTDLLQLVEVGDKTKYQRIEGETVLSEHFQIYKVEGQITANSVSAVSALGSKAGRDKIMIDGTLYNVGETNAEIYLGYNVEIYYYKSKDDTVGTIRYIRPRMERMECVEVDARDIEPGETTLKTLAFYDENENLKRKTVSPTADLIYNGVARSLNSKFLLTPENGKVLLLDSDNSGDYDVVLVTSYIMYVVSAVNADRFTISDMYGQNQIMLDPQDSSVTYRIERDGKLVKDITGLSQWDVLSVAASSEYVDDEGIRRIDSAKSIHYDVVATTYNEIGVISTYDEDTLTVNGTVYNVSEYYKYLIKTNKIYEPNLGAIYTFHFNSDHEIVTIDDEGLETAGGYGYLLGVDAKSTIDSTVRLKILESTGKITEFVCNDKVTLDGRRGVKAFDGSKSDVFTALTDNSGKAVKQIIGYSTNNDGKIKVVDTKELDAGGNNSSSLGYYGELKNTLGYKSSDKTLGDRFVFDSTAVLFCVPAKETVEIDDGNGGKTTVEVTEGGAWDNDKNFSVGSVSSVLSNDDKPYLDVYNVGRSNAIELAVIYGKTSASMTANTYISVIEKITTAVNANGENVIRVYGMKDGVAFTNDLSPDGFTIKMYDGTNPYPDASVILNNSYNGTPVLETGDVIRFGTDSEGYIKEVEFVVDASNPEAYQNLNNHGVASRTVYGMLYDCYNGFAELVFDPNEAEKDTDRESYVYALKSVPIMLYDGNKETVRTASVADLTSYRDCRDTTTATKMAINARYGEVRSIVIYTNMD